MWLGGILFFALVGAPVLRSVEPPSLRMQLFERLGLRFRWVGWAAIGVLLVTGVLNLHLRDLLRAELLSDSAFWRSAYGTMLALKLLAVAAMVGLSALHDFVLGPRSVAMKPGSPEAAAARRWALHMARGAALAGLIVLLAAIRLARGG